MDGEVPYLLAGLVLGLLIGGFGLTWYSSGDFDYSVDYEPAGVQMGDPEAVGEAVLAFLGGNFLEPRGLEGKVSNVTEFVPGIYQVDIAVIFNGRTVDNAPVYATADGEMVFLQPPTPLNTVFSEEEDVPQEPSEPQLTDINVEGDPFRGDPNAPVTIIEFSEYQCPYCGASAGTNDALISQFKSQDPSWEPAIPNIVENYVATGKVKMVFKDYPLPFHEFAIKAAEASMCAYEQDQFWAYHDILFENQDALDIDSLKGYAGELGLNTADFNECLDTSRYAGEVERDLLEGQALGVSGTPAFFINGKMITGAQPYSAFVGIIEAELAE